MISPAIYCCEGTANSTESLNSAGTVNDAFLLQKLTGDWRGSRLPPWLAIRYRIVLRMRSYLTYTC